MSSKARYYLEQCIPEVDDMVEKGLFTKKEVSSIMKKRTNFEHRLNSRGSTINDYIKYINYEAQVDKLRSKRVQRILQAKKTNSISDWTIQQRIAFIYQRGCQKFPKDLRFWAMYLHYLKNRGNQASYKKIHKVYNDLLRLHPTNVEVWISCAKYEYEVHANFKSCRVVFQTGLRFNPDSFKLWYEYIKFELNFITKLINRRKVMKLINEREQELDMTGKQGEKGATDMIKAPSTGDAMKDSLNELPEADMNMLGDPDTNPALKGDIALAIFDTAMKTLGKYYIEKHRGYYAVVDQQIDESLRKECTMYLFEKSKAIIALFDRFEDLQRDYLINHILQYWKNDNIYDISLSQQLPDYYLDVILMDVTMNIRYMSSRNLDPDQLQLSVKKYFAYKAKMDDKLVRPLHVQFVAYLREHLLGKNEEDNPQRRVIEQLINKL